MLDEGIVWWESKLMDGNKEQEKKIIGATFLTKEAKYFLKIDVVLGFFVIDKMKVVSQFNFLLCK